MFQDCACRAPAARLLGPCALAAPLPMPPLLVAQAHTAGRAANCLATQHGWWALPARCPPVCAGRCPPLHGVRWRWRRLWASNRRHACCAAPLPMCRTACTCGSPPLCPPQVLDYQNTSHTLLPLVASAYAVHFMGESIYGLYKQFDKDRWGLGLGPRTAGVCAPCDGVIGRGWAHCAGTRASGAWPPLPPFSELPLLLPPMRAGSAANSGACRSCTRCRQAARLCARGE